MQKQYSFGIFKRSIPKKIKLEDLQEDMTFEEIATRVIEEAMTGGMVMRTHESKREAAISAIAVSIAKKKGDPLYNILKRHRDAWKHAKNDLIMRYRGQAEMKYQQNQSKF